MDLCGLLALLVVSAASTPTHVHEDVVSLLQNAAQGALQPTIAKVADRRRQAGSDVGASPEESIPTTYKIGEAAEVKSQRFAGLGGWAICLIIKPGEQSNSYDVVIPGAAILRNVPSLMLRKKRKATTPAPKNSGELVPDLPPAEEVAGVDGRIDGEPGENVEILMRSGPRAGSWVMGSIAVTGKLPDTYDVRVLSEDGNFTVMSSVPGNSMRKVDPSQVLVTEEEITYRVGDRVEVKHAPKSGRSTWVPGVIAGLGSRPDTFTIIASSGHLFDIPKSVLRPKPILEADLLRRKKEPVLTDSAFQVGEDVEVKTVEGGVAGLWLSARISGRGPIPFTYYVNLTQWKIEDLVNALTYHELIRRPGQALNRAATSFYEIGERIEFKALNENSSGWWWNGTIVNKSKVPDSYDVILPSGKKLPSVPVELMRKVWFDESRLPRVACREYRTGDAVEYKNIMTGTWFPANITGEAVLKGAYDIKDMFGLQLVSMPELLRRPATSFQAGDPVEVQSWKNKELVWTRSVVQSLGKSADTYDIYVEDVGLIESVPMSKLRQADPIAQRELLIAYQVGEKIEMLELYGRDAGQWLGGTITSKGSLKFTYNITVPGFGVMADIPIETVRKVPSSRFKVGEFVKVRIQAGPSKGYWGSGLVAAVGSMPETFNISFWKIGVVPNVPLQLLRKENEPWRIENMPYFEVGAPVKVRSPIGDEAGSWSAGTVVAHTMVWNSSRGPRPQLYTVSFPSHPEVGDIPDIPAELIVRDEFVRRPAQFVDNFQINDTVQLRGLISPGGAPWVKMYIVKNSTKYGCYDVHFPGHGIFPNMPVELIRRQGVKQPPPSFEVNQKVEMYDFLDIIEQLWFPGKIKGRGIRPGTYDVVSAVGIHESVAAELLRRADGQEVRPVQRIYQEGDIVEVKDVLGMMSPSARTKAAFRVVAKGKVSNTFDIEGTHVGIVESVPSVMFVKVNLEDIQAMSETIEPGEFVECHDVDKPGNQGLCYIDSEGERPGTFNVRKIGYNGVFPNIPTTRLHKEQSQLLPELSSNISVSVLQSKRAKEPKVGDAVEVRSQVDGNEEWLQGTIVRKVQGKNTFDVDAGESGTLKNVPAAQLRFPSTDEEDGPAVKSISTTSAPQAEEDGPLQIGDWVRYIGPGANASNISTMWQARVLGLGQVPLTYTLGLNSGFVMSNVPLPYLMKDWRLGTTTTQPMDITNAWASFTLVLPTIKAFQTMLQKQDEDAVKAWQGDFKALVSSEITGKNLGDGAVTYEIGEQAEVQIVHGEMKGQWTPCLISGMGKWKNSYNIRLADAPEEVRNIANVGSKILRKLTLDNDPEAAKIRAASPCSDEDRRLMRKRLEKDGPFNNNPEECNKVATVWGGLRADAAGECVQRKLSLSAQCASCAADFTKEFLSEEAMKGGCLQKCLSSFQVCKDPVTSGPACVLKTGACLSCMKTPVISLLKCIGTSDSSTPSRIDQLADAAASGHLLSEGGLASIFGSRWVADHSELLQPIFGAAMGSSSEESAVEDQQDARSAAFRVGDKADIHVESGPHAGAWVECEITGQGRLADHYNIHIPSAPEGKKDFKDVSSRVLRLSEASEREDPLASSQSETNEDPL